MIAIGNSVASVCGTVMRSVHIRSKHRLLAILDFDNTIINGDCYEAVGELLSQPQETTEKLTNLIKERNWIKYIQNVLKLIHEQGVNSTEMLQQVRQLPEVPGMMCLLRRLAHKSSIDMCILSDANSLFITEWLKANNLHNIFTAIYTNPAKVVNDGYLQVDPYEQQTHCDLCPANLCKGSVIKALMNCTENNFNRIIYVGDSCNDLCPILCMRQQDVACIRRDEELHEKLPSYIDNIRAQVLIWRDGHELQQQLVSSGIL